MITLTNVENIARKHFHDCIQHVNLNLFISYAHIWGNNDVDSNDDV